MLRYTLRQVCEVALQQVAGYQYLTHQVNYKVFPASLYIECFFVEQEALQAADKKTQAISLKETIKVALAGINIELKNVNKQVKFKVK